MTASNIKQIIQLFKLAKLLVVSDRDNSFFFLQIMQSRYRIRNLTVLLRLYLEFKSKHERFWFV